MTPVFGFPPTLHQCIFSVPPSEFLNSLSYGGTILYACQATPADDQIWLQIDGCATAHATIPTIGTLGIALTHSIYCFAAKYP